MSASLARFLKDFGEPVLSPPVPVIADAFPDAASNLVFDVSEPDEPPVDLEAARAEAFEKGRRSALEECEKRFADEREALVAAHAQDMKALEEKYGTETAARVAAQIEDAAADVAQALSGETAKILAPLLDEALTAKAMTDMAELVRAAVLEGACGTLTVYGPLPLFEKLKAALGEPAPLFRHVEAPDLDITVDIGETTFVTRMSAWSASLKKVLA